MERQVYQSPVVTYVCCSLVVLFHIVGLAVFLNEALTPFFLRLVPFHLLLMASLLLTGQHDKQNGFWLCVVVMYFAGFITELAGVNTGLVFGSYIYGNTLGYKIAGTPVLIGINWLILTFSTGALLRSLGIGNPWAGSFAGAGLMLLLDVFIEPVAVKFDYWSWSGPEVPVRNYAAWFIVSFLMMRLQLYFRFEKLNPVAAILYPVQLIFFIALNLWGL